MDLKEIVEAHKVWANKNFPDMTAEDCLLGMVEEVGELAHAVLKSRQGIRNADKKEELVKDAIADIAIFTMDFCNRSGFDFNKFYYCNPHKPQMPLDKIENLMVSGLAYNCGSLGFDYSFFDVPGIEKHLKEILGRLRILSDAYGFYLPEIIAETWEEVSKRDWTKNKETGVNDA